MSTPCADEHQHDQQPAQAAVAIQEGVDRRELQMCLSPLWQPRRRRPEECVARPGSADPVLAAAEFARQVISTATATAGQLPVEDLAQQAGGEGEALPQPGQIMVPAQPRSCRPSPPRQTGRRGFLQFEQQQIGEGRLGALDLGGEQGLPPPLGVEEHLGVGQQRLLVQRLQGSVQSKSVAGLRARTASPAVLVILTWPQITRLVFLRIWVLDCQLSGQQRAHAPLFSRYGSWSWR